MHLQRSVKDILLVTLTSALLILSFPKADVWFFAWMAFVPLFVALEGRSARSSFLYAYFCGLIFFCGVFYWFIHVTVVGAILIILYFSLYFGVFGYIYASARHQSKFIKVIFLSCSWVMLEFIRSHLMTGFGWAALAHSQYKNLVMLQIADVTGFYGVSFLVMMVNVSLKEIISDFKHHRIKSAIPLALSVMGLLLSVFLYGSYRMNQTYEGPTLSVSIVQANIPQELKWYEPSWPDIMEKYKIITRQAALDHPDLIVWPETAFPGYLGEHDDYFDQLRRFVDELNIPLLLGTVAKEGNDYYNSAVLLDGQGRIIEQYNKLHLVMFGEYIPFRKWFPFLTDIIPIADFTPGENYVLFPSPSGKSLISTLICFEDSVPYVSREFVQRGSNLLINITNDAWFKDTKMPYMHLATSVFRAIENRRELIRAANTGISVFIGADGALKQRVSNKQGKETYVSGFTNEKVTLINKQTLYSTYGDIFSMICSIIALGLIFQIIFRQKRKV